MSGIAAAGQDYSLPLVLPSEMGVEAQSTKRKNEDEGSDLPSKMRKLESTDTKVFPLLALPQEILCSVVRRVANGYWFSKSCQNMLSVNKDFYYKVMPEVLKFDGLAGGDFASDIINHPGWFYMPEEEMKKKFHRSVELMLKDKTVHDCVQKIRAAKADGVIVFPILFPHCKTLIVSDCSNDMSLLGLWFFKNLQELRLLDLSKCRDGDNILFPYLEHPLQRLTLVGIKHLSDLGLSTLVKQAKLREFDLEGSEKLTTIPHSDFTDLQLLRLANCKKLTQGSLSGLTTMTKIQKLVLEDYTEQAVLNFSTPSDLQEFTIKDYSDLSALTFSDLPKFQKLNIEDCSKLTSLVLSNLPKLQEVNIKGSKVLPAFSFSKLNMSSFNTDPTTGTKITFSS